MVVCINNSNITVSEMNTQICYIDLSQVNCQLCIDLVGYLVFNYGNLGLTKLQLLITLMVINTLAPGRYGSNCKSEV